MHSQFAEPVILQVHYRSQEALKVDHTDNALGNKASTTPRSKRADYTQSSHACN